VYRLWTWQFLPWTDSDPYTFAGSKPGGTGEGRGRG
jgi:hypothetical protein